MKKNYIPGKQTSLAAAIVLMSMCHTMPAFSGGPVIIGSSNYNDALCQAYVSDQLGKEGMTAVYGTASRPASANEALNQAVATGRVITADQARPGDLVYFSGPCTNCGRTDWTQGYGHASIYNGNGTIVYQGVDANGKGHIYSDTVTDYVANHVGSPVYVAGPAHIEADNALANLLATNPYLADAGDATLTGGFAADPMAPAYASAAADGAATQSFDYAQAYADANTQAYTNGAAFEAFDYAQAYADAYAGNYADAAADGANFQAFDYAQAYADADAYVMAEAYTAAAADGAGFEAFDYAQAYADAYAGNYADAAADGEGFQSLDYAQAQAYADAQSYGDTSGDGADGGALGYAGVSGEGVGYGGGDSGGDGATPGSDGAGEYSYGDDAGYGSGDGNGGFVF